MCGCSVEWILFHHLSLRATSDCRAYCFDGQVVWREWLQGKGTGSVVWEVVEVARMFSGVAGLPEELVKAKRMCWEADEMKCDSSVDEWEQGV